MSVGPSGIYDNLLDSNSMIQRNMIQNTYNGCMGQNNFAAISPNSSIDNIKNDSNYNSNYIPPMKNPIMSVSQNFYNQINNTSPNTSYSHFNNIQNGTCIQPITNSGSISLPPLSSVMLDMRIPQQDISNIKLSELSHLPPQQQQLYYQQQFISSHPVSPTKYSMPNETYITPPSTANALRGSTFVNNSNNNNINNIDISTPSSISNDIGNRNHTNQSNNTRSETNNNGIQFNSQNQDNLTISNTKNHILPSINQFNSLEASNNESTELKKPVPFSLSSVISPLLDKGLSNEKSKNSISINSRDMKKRESTGSTPTNGSLANSDQSSDSFTINSLNTITKVNGKTLIKRRLSPEIRKTKQCPVCGKICSRPSTLRTHYFIHTGDTPFKCSWVDCGKSFNVKSNMIRHMKNHMKKLNKHKQGQKKNDSDITNSNIENTVSFDKTI